MVFSECVCAVQNLDDIEHEDKVLDSLQFFAAALSACLFLVGLTSF